MPNNKFRVIGGQWRGRKFSFPDVTGIRPTPDRVRETLFNWLHPVIEQAHCLDLFAGSGAITLEALSRGAAQVTAVDSSSQAIGAIKQHLAVLDCRKAKLVVNDAMGWLKHPGENNSRAFDLVFLDPPFQRQLIEPCCALLDKNGLLAPGARIYIEAEPEYVPELPPSWEIIRNKRAGQVAYYLCRKNDPALGS